MRALALSLVLCAAAAPAWATALDRQPELRPQTGYIKVAGPAQHTLPGNRLALSGQRTVIFFNRNGGAYHNGLGDNSLVNQAFAVFVDGEVQLPAWTYGDAKWAELMTCIRGQFARFDVEITDVDPGSTPHLEHVVGGLPTMIGQTPSTGGVASMNGDCSPMENGVSFTFSEAYAGNVQLICETAAQETAHSLGLDHEYLCQDPMTYLRDCGPKSFQDVDAQCGEYGARACNCPDRPTQNSVQWLRQVLGDAPSAPPQLSITSPQDGAVVPRDLMVAAQASDASGVAQVVIEVDGQTAATLTAPPFETELAGLALGEHSITVRATAQDGGVTTADIGITVSTDVQPGNDDPGSVGDGQVTGGCSVGQRGQGGLGLVLLGLLLLRRRRR